MAQEAKWYVVHTYSGYENKVKVNLEKTIENNNLHHIFFDIKVPMEEVIEVKDDEKKSVMKKMLPGYIIIKMIMTDFSWYIVRNTRGVTGFVGPGSKPIPLTDEEVTAMGVERIALKLDVAVGENVRITSGPFENFVGTVKALDPENQKVKLAVLMFGKENMLELDYIAVQKI